MPRRPPATVSSGDDASAPTFVELGFYSFTPATGQANFDNVIVDWVP